MGSKLLNVSPPKVEHTHVAWAQTVHKLGEAKGETKCGVEIPSPDKVGPVGYYTEFPADHPHACKRCSRTRAKRLTVSRRTEPSIGNIHRAGKSAKPTVKERFVAALVAVLTEAGAKRASKPYLAYEYVLDTKGGRLHLSVRGNLSRPGASVYGRFENVGAGCKTLGCRPKNISGEVDGFSGKWNQHYFTRNVDDAVRNLRYQLARVAP
jgi:hypothetical protein